MWQLVFANIPIEGWVIGSDQHSFFDGSGHALVFPVHFAEIVQGHFVTCGVTVVMYW